MLEQAPNLEFLVDLKRVPTSDWFAYITNMHTYSRSDLGRKMRY